MAVPFGFSAGDIAIAIKLTVQIANAMRDTGGAASDYEQSFDYWKDLLVVYQRLNGLHAQCTDPELLQEIRALAAEAEKPVHRYIKGLQTEFGAALNDHSISAKSLRSFKKAKWALHASKKEEKFSKLMSAQLQTIEVKFQRLNMTGLDHINHEIVKLLGQHDVHVTEQQKVNAVLLTILGDIQHSMRPILHEEIETPAMMASREEFASEVEEGSSNEISVGKCLLNIISRWILRMGQIAQLLYPFIVSMFLFLHKTSLEKIRSLSLVGGDVIKFEDGLGRIFDLPYQWFHNWRTFQGFLQDQFHGAAGERYVASDRYHLLNSVHGRLIQKPFHSWSRSVYPGAKIAMSMAVNESLLPMYECPKCNTQLNYDYTDTIIHRPRHRCWTGYKADNTPRMNERDYSRSKEHLTHEPQALDSSASTGEINSPYANMETTSESDIDDFQQDADELEAEVRCFNRIHFQSPPRELPRVPKKAIEDSSRDFACPFYKHNPQRHYPCSGPSLTILRLKEHLFRCHKTS